MGTVEEINSEEIDQKQAEINKHQQTDSFECFSSVANPWKASVPATSFLTNIERLSPNSSLKRDDDCTVFGEFLKKQKLNNGFPSSTKRESEFKTVGGKGRAKLGKEKLGKEKKVTKEYYMAFEFKVNDVVWAKCGKRFPAWPALVIDPLNQAPASVLVASVPAAACVVFYPLTDARREYGWIQDGMIFPFQEFMDRFKGQTQLFGSTKKDFRRAIEEAFKTENDYINNELNHVQTQKAAGSKSSRVQEHCSRKKNGYGGKATQLCESCGVKIVKETSSCPELLMCDNCVKLKSKQCCGICEKIWHQTDGKFWVHCKFCDHWLHADCAKIPKKYFKSLDIVTYYCPGCKPKSNSTPSTPKKSPLKVSKSTEENGQAVMPETVAVVCAGMEGLYYPSLHLVECKCGSCGTKKLSVGEWERHTGCRAKKWKVSIKVKDSTLTLEKWLNEYNAHGINPLKLDKPQLLSFLKEKYEPVNAKWTSERCAVCRWIEDWDYNKIIICNRCQIAVHQECYGVGNTEDFASWVCRACETPDVERECCLCPVKGGALKPTDIDSLWVHVTCAWFRPEVAFSSDEKMEPAVGILRIPAVSFAKACVICNQTHGSCTQCCKCATYFHSMCASRAGYCMELHCSENGGVQITKWQSYCANHREPNADNVLVIQTPSGVFANRSLLQNQNNQDQHFRGSRLIPCNLNKRIEKGSHSSIPKFDAVEPVSASRCLIYDKTNNKKIDKEAIFHRVMGPIQHEIQEIDCKGVYRGMEELNALPSFQEKLAHLRTIEDTRVCFGKSGIHEAGLFARRNIQEGEMVIEYRGEQVRQKIADTREALYKKQNKDCYFLSINEDLVIDATYKGNIARLINHSCMPNCYTRIISISPEESRIVLMAKSDVSAGDELTFDYNFAKGETEDMKVPCLCKASNCRGFMDRS